MSLRCSFLIAALAASVVNALLASTGLAQAPPASRPSQPAPSRPATQTQAGQPRPAVGHMPQAPFQLSPEQAQQVDDVLTAWEQQSEKVKTLSSGFTLFEYDPVFGDANKPKRTVQGEVSYAAPDRGRYELLDENDPEKWVCDGKSVFQYDYKQRKLLELPLPPEQRGKAIVDGPLPFLFGAEKDKIKARYFVRVNFVDQQTIQLEAYPRWAGDAANFAKVDVILSRATMLPTALQLWQPNQKNRSVYRFDDKPKINSGWDALRDRLATPFAPPGWKKEVQPLAPPGGNAARPPVNQAQRPPANQQRQQ